MALYEKQSLSVEEQKELDDLLGRVEAAVIPNVEALDGFLTAIVVGPELIMPSEFLPFITDSESDQTRSINWTPSEKAKHSQLVIRAWCEISAAYCMKACRQPLFLPDEHGTVFGNHWAQGFLTGTLLRSDAWAKLAEQDDHAIHFLPIWALAYEHATDPEHRPVAEPMPDEQRRGYLAALSQSAQAFNDHFADLRARYSQQQTADLLNQTRKTA